MEKQPLKQSSTYSRNKPKIVKILVDDNEVKVEVDLASRIDPIGYVFKYNDGIYRMIRPRNIGPVKEFLNVKNIQEIFDAGLVETKIAKNMNGGKNYPIILNHHKVEFPSYKMEWTPDMLRDAAMMLVNLGQELLRSNYTLIDNHTYNVFFDFMRPVYIDFGSINKMSSKFPALWAGYFRASWVKELEKVSDLTIDAFEQIRTRNMNDANKFFNEVRTWLNSANFKYNVTEWAGYGQKAFNFDNLPPKQKVVYDVLKELRDEMSSVIDIGANQGVYSEVAADLGYKVIATDIDQTSISKLYNRNKYGKRKILPVIFDFGDPTKAHGKITDGYVCASDRFKSDISMSLALIHHMAYKQRVSFDDFARRINNFTRYCAIVEFIPPTDRHIAGWPNRPAEYNQANFIKSMMNYFDRYEIRESNPAPRTMIIFRKD